MTYNEAETRFWLIDPVLRGKGFNAHWKLKLETPAPVEPTGNKGRRRAGARSLAHTGQQHQKN